MATVQSYTKAGVDQKLADRSYRVLPHAGGGTPNLASYPDAKSGDIIERNSDGARWNVLSGTLNPETGRVVSVAGKTGIVTLGPTDIGAAPASHTHTKAQITDLNASTAATANSMAQRDSGGRLVVGTPTTTTHAATKAYVDSAITGAKAWVNLTGVPSTFTPSAHTHTVAQISDLTLTTAATANTTPLRDSAGRFAVANPSTAAQVANKGYVDSAISASTAWSAITGKPSTFTPSTHTHSYNQITDSPKFDMGYNKVASDLAPTDFPAGVSYGLSNAQAYGWNETLLLDVPNAVVPNFWMILTARHAIYDGSTIQQLYSYDLVGIPIYMRKWDHVLEKWGSFRAITDDRHTHRSSDVRDSTDVLHGNYPSRLLRTREDGQLYIYSESITSNNHATNKQYVDQRVNTRAATSHTHTSDNITDAVTYASGSTTNGNKLLKTDSSGRVTASDPTSTSHVANKNYVDSVVDAKTTWANTSGKPSTFPPAAHTHTIANITDLTVSTSATQDTVAKRIASGRLTVGTPTATTDATTKAYVDSQITSAKAWGNLTGVPSTFAPATHTHTIAQITDLTVATTATANTVAQRTTGGRLVVGTPSANSEATTKAYVDSAVTASKAWANLTGKPSEFPPIAHTHTKSQITDLPTIGTGIAGDSVVQRTSNGQILVHNSPSDDQHAASKNYVDRTLDAKFESTLLELENLNNIEDPGSYSQRVDSNATTARNYPNNRKSGHLVVTGSDDFVLQEYTEYDSKAKYYRTKYGATWYPWVRIAEEPWTGTQAQYNAITTKDPNRLYIIVS